MKAILLAAGRARRMGHLTARRPQCMVEIAGTPLLHWQLEALREAGIKDTVIVRGYCRTRIEGRGARYVDNPKWSATGWVGSLAQARHELRGEVVVAGADLLFLPSIIDHIKSSPAAVGLAVDSRGEPTHAIEGRVDLENLSSTMARGVGLLKLGAAGSDALRGLLAEAALESEFGNGVFGSDRALGDAHLEDLVRGLVRMGVVVQPVPIRGGWTKVGSVEQRRHADRLVASPVWRRSPSANQGHGHAARP